MRGSPKVRTLFASLMFLVVLAPVLTLYLLRIYESYLVRQTEEVLIAEAVLAGEIYRALSHPADAVVPLVFPQNPEAERYYPFFPSLDVRRAAILPPAERGPSFGATATVSPILTAILERSLVRNLSAIRVLDREGRVIASPLRETGYSLAQLPEVAAALEGRYEPALRERRSAHPQGLGKLSRTSKIRLSIAIPVYRDPQAAAGEGGEVIAAIYNSRTPLDVERSLWLIRQELFWVLLVALVVVLGAVVIVALLISRPLARLRRAAEQVAAGDAGARLEVDGFAPQEVAALSAALGRMRDQLRARAVYVEEFATNTVHELKTPLTSLRGAAELLLDSSETMSIEQRRRFLENLHQDAVRMDQLVLRILHLARIESSSPVRQAIDLEAFLVAVVERYARRGHQVQLEYRSAIRRVKMDPDQLESMIANLLDNAVLHGGGAPIEVRVEDGPDVLTLTVRDHGPPVPRERFERIFERFYTTERNRGGTGLGLSIVRAIALAHGGRVEARAEERGASFIVTLTGASAP